MRRSLRGGTIGKVANRPHRLQDSAGTLKDLVYAPNLKPLVPPLVSRVFAFVGRASACQRPLAGASSRQN
ncbi:hypothetical protein SBA3_1040023 [Candidatus Sulfopaludibacter sp. SbA3]|nr:hypothetical protein SBA3_1040023 [Candidatus Sulfopaludibacter sp. SbA3]